MNWRRVFRKWLAAVSVLCLASMAGRAESATPPMTVIEVSAGSRRLGLLRLDLDRPVYDVVLSRSVRQARVLCASSSPSVRVVGTRQALGVPGSAVIELDVSGRVMICQVRLRRGARRRRAAGVGVDGNRLTLDGRPWLPRGAGFGAFTYAPCYADNGTAPGRSSAGGFVGAARRFGPDILDAAKTWKIDSIRFLVSQPGLDPQSDIYSEEYVSALTSGVKLCREKGFTVILAMQDQQHSGETDVKPLPTEQTMRAWNTIGPAFAKDPYIVFEIFNECAFPAPRASVRQNWDYWLDGGRTAGRTYIGHQQIVNAFRARGWSNVLIVDGMPWADAVDNHVLRLTDPLFRLAYGVHPYFKAHNNEPAEWEKSFGELSSHVPVLVTEWFANSKVPFGVKSYDIPQWCEQFLNYLQRRRLPLWVFGFDIPTTTVKDFRGTPLTWDRFRPGDIQIGERGAGAGAQVRQHFLTQEQWVR